MNILLWVLQVLLALHTFIGATWKTANSEQSVSSLQAMPHGVWLTLIVLEILCSLGLVLPVFLNNPWRKLVPVSAICIAAEMFLFSGLLLSSGSAEYSHLVYWVVVAAICAFIVYGRWVLKPL
jgi:hypothetical protein